MAKGGGVFKVKRIDHVVLRTANIGKMVEFYSQVLGCDVERQVDSIGLFQLRTGEY